MQPVNPPAAQKAPQQPKIRRDPAPSRWSYRMQRLMLTPLFRRVLRLGLPFAATLSLGTWYLSDPAVQQQIILGVADMRQQLEERPEFRVKLLSIDGASVALADEIREIFPVALPASSFDIDLDGLRLLIEGMPPVATAALRIRQGGVLELQVRERMPAALWQTRDGLRVLDVEGVVIAVADDQSDHKHLPLLTGAGAEMQVKQALALHRAAEPLGARMLGLVRMGARRWDVVLDRDQRILLPEASPVRALERVIVLGQTQDMLERDIAVVDMRLAQRPAVRMRERAVDAWWRVRGLSTGTGEQ